MGAITIKGDSAEGENCVEKYIAAVNSYIDSHHDEIISLWRDLVQLEGKTEEKEHIDLVAARLKKELENSGMDCRYEEVSPVRGKSLLGTLGMERQAKPVIFCGHFDTVFKKGAFGENPFRIEAGKAYGPGALDMKGGIVIAIFVIRALNYAGYDERPIKIILSSDEEGGHKDSTGAEFIEREAAGGVCAFNMETGPVDNSLCTGRSTSVRINMTVTGIEAHAGNNYTKGRNAIVEAAHKLIKIQELTTLDRGTTVNTGVIQGGTVVNAVAGQCRVEFDFRFKKQEEIDRVIPLAEEILKTTIVDGTRTDYEIEQSGLKIYDANEEVDHFFAFVNQTALKYGYAPFGQVTLGGASDAGAILSAGTPVICSFGVRGEWNHTAREYAVVDAMYERAKIIAAVILEIKGRQDFKQI